MKTKVTKLGGKFCTGVISCKHDKELSLDIVILDAANYGVSSVRLKAPVSDVSRITKYGKFEFHKSIFPLEKSF